MPSTYVTVTIHSLPCVGALIFPRHGVLYQSVALSFFARPLFYSAGQQKKLRRPKPMQFKSKDRREGESTWTGNVGKNVPGSG